MWRAFFLAGGIFLCVLGAECLVVDKFVMAGDTVAHDIEHAVTPESPATLFGSTAPAAPSAKKEITPAEWAPWSLLSAGAVVILYSLTINKQG